MEVDDSLDGLRTPTLENQLGPDGIKIVSPGDSTYPTELADKITREGLDTASKVRMEPIFNKLNFDNKGYLDERGGTDKGDGKRHQGAFGNETTLATSLEPVIDDNLSGAKPDDYVILGREEGCAEQPLHRDAKYGAFMVLALTDNYTLRVRRGSHLPLNEVHKNMDDMEQRRAIDVCTLPWELITLQKGQIAFIHGCLIHAGGPASTGQPAASDKYQDLAIHCYLDEDGAPERCKDKTFAVLGSVDLRQQVAPPGERADLCPDRTYYNTTHGSTEPFTGHGVSRFSTGRPWYIGDFDKGHPHGECQLYLTKRGRYSGKMRYGESCGLGVMDGKAGLYDANVLSLDGEQGYDADAEPGCEEFTLHFQADGDNQGKYERDAGTGGVTYCDEVDAEDYWRAHVIRGLKLPIQPAIQMMRASRIIGGDQDIQHRLRNCASDYYVTVTDEEPRATITAYIQYGTSPDGKMWIQDVYSDDANWKENVKILVQNTIAKQAEGSLLSIKVSDETVLEKHWIFMLNNLGFSRTDAEPGDDGAIMSIKCGEEDFVMPPNMFIFERYKFSEEEIEDAFKPPRGQKRKSKSNTRKGKQKKKPKGGDWTDMGRGKFRKQGGTVVAAPRGQEHKTCVPDATFVCLKNQGAAVTKEEARECLATARSTTLYDMEPVLEKHGFEVVSAGKGYLSNPRNTLSLMQGHYIVLMDLWDEDGDHHKHACALSELNGNMHIIDNMARIPVKQIGPEDRVNQEEALKVFAGESGSMFPGAVKLIIRSVWEVRRQ